MAYRFNEHRKFNPGVPLSSFGLPEGAFDIDSHAFEGPPTQRHVRGVILVSPAYQLPVAFETAQVVDLASRGWTLVTLDHPHETAIAEQPGGTWVNGDLDRASPFLARLVDVGVVLDQLSALVPGWYPGIPVAMFGHSMGGSAAAEAMLLYPTYGRGSISTDRRGVGWSTWVSTGPSASC
jgi:alpha-beta hydrolase superfamily lysophospholipase